MFGALQRGFRSMASLILVRNVVGELQPKRTLAASRGFLAAARLSCLTGTCPVSGHATSVSWHWLSLHWIARPWWQLSTRHLGSRLAHQLMVALAPIPKIKGDYSPKIIVSSSFVTGWNYSSQNITTQRSDLYEYWRADTVASPEFGMRCGAALRDNNLGVTPKHPKSAKRRKKTNASIIRFHDATCETTSTTDF